MSVSVKLSDVAEFVMGQSPPSTSYNDAGYGLPFYQGKTDFGATYPTPRIFCREPKKLAEDGDILMSVRAPVGATNLCQSKSCIGRGIAAIRAKGIDRDFLYFYLKKIEAYIDSLGSGAIFKAINKSQLAELPINEAGISIPEQKKIAHILATVQRAIEAQEKIIQTTTELKKALMHKLFTEGLHNEHQKQTEIGPVPESWKIVELKTTGDVVYGIQAAVASNLAVIGTPILTNKNITLDGCLDLEKLNYFKLTSKHHLATILQKGDILFNWRSGSKFHVGKTAYFDLDDKWVHSSFILRIRPDQKINGRYLFYYFNHLREAEFFVKLQTYAINAKFNKSAVNALPTVVPSRDEQDDIADILDSAQRKIDSVKQKRRVLQEIFRTLLHELMIAMIRVDGLEIEGERPTV